MTTLNWKPAAKQPDSITHTSSTTDPWFGTACGLVGLIIGYFIALLHIL